MNSGTSIYLHRQRDAFRRPQRVGSADQQRLDFDRRRHRGGRRRGRRHWVLQPLKWVLRHRDRQSSVRLERLGWADHQRDSGGPDGLTLKQAQSFAATISGFGTSDTIDATNFLETATSYNFFENIAGTGGTLTLTDTSSDRQYPDDRRLFEQEFHPRPRQRDRHAGEVRLSERRSPRRAGMAGNRVRERSEHIKDGRPNWTAARVTRLYVGEVLGAQDRDFGPTTKRFADDGPSPPLLGGRRRIEFPSRRFAGALMNACFGR